jgi:hypothetical protein
MKKVVPTQAGTTFFYSRIFIAFYPATAVATLWNTQLFIRT